MVKDKGYLWGSNPRACLGKKKVILNDIFVFDRGIFSTNLDIMVIQFLDNEVG